MIGFQHRHGRTDTFVHRLPAGLKLGFAVALIALTVAMPLRAASWFIAVALLLAAALAAGRVPPIFLLKRLAILLPFVAGVALVNLLHPAAGAPWVAVGVRGVLCLATVVILANTTAFSEILPALRRLHVPAIMITTMALMHRYLYVLAEEAQRMRRARASRTFRGDLSSRWWAQAEVAGQLFVRASERAERIYAAMCARGWR